MPESEPEEPTYSRDEFVSELTSYYELLTHLYLPPEVVRYPPPGGWEHITPDFVKSFFLGKNDTVADLMRHIPYVRHDKEDNNWNRFHIYERCSQVDFAGEVVLSLPTKYADEWLFELPDVVYPHPLPPHVFVFAVVPDGRYGHFILVDTERGTIVLMDLTDDTKPTRLSDPSAPDEEEWRRSATYTFSEFFGMAKDMFRSFRMISMNREVYFASPDDPVAHIYQEEGAFTERYDRERCMSRIKAYSESRFRSTETDDIDGTNVDPVI